jgi:hypothetical protein
VGHHVTTSIDGGETHNFIDVALVARRCMHIEEFEGSNVVMDDGFNMTCMKNIMRLVVTLGNYTLTNNFYLVDLANTDIFLGIQWLDSLWEITINYKVTKMKFNTKNDKKVVLRGMSNGGPNIVSTKSMEAIFRHGDVSCVVDCFITAQEKSQGQPHHHENMHALLIRNDKVFGQIPVRRPPDKGFENTMVLEKGGKNLITTPYIHPNKFKDEIEKSINELLEMGNIRPSSSPFSSFVVLVKTKDGKMHMCIDYRGLKKNMIKNRYHISRINEILNELHGEMYFLNIDLPSGYHHIRVKEQDIPKTTFRLHNGNYEFWAFRWT